MGRKNFKIETVQIRGILFDKWLLKIERWCFGWQYYGDDTQDESYLEEDTDGRIVQRHNYITWLEFRRISPFSKNILFNLAELLSRMFSFLRRFVLALGGPFAILILILSLAGMGCDESLAQSGFQVLEYFAIIYFAGLVGGTLLFALLGKFWRVVFRIDQKLQQELRDNGYNDDITDCD